MRSRQVSRPSTSRVANSGGAFLRPHTATRMGWNIWPALMPRALAAERSVFQRVVRELGRGRAPRGRVPAPAAPWPRRLSAGSARRCRTAATASTKKKSATVSTSRSNLMRSCISGVIRSILARSTSKARGLARTAASRSRQFLHRQRADVLGIQPHRLGIEGIFLGEIDHRVAAIDAFERERVDQFLASSSLRDRPWATSPAGTENSRTPAAGSRHRDKWSRSPPARAGAWRAWRHRARSAAADARTAAARRPAASKISTCLKVLVR